MVCRRSFTSQKITTKLYHKLTTKIRRLTTYTHNIVLYIHSKNVSTQKNKKAGPARKMMWVLFFFILLVKKLHCGQTPFPIDPFSYALMWGSVEINFPIFLGDVKNLIAKQITHLPWFS